jgi:hypothetical protein
MHTDIILSDNCFQSLLIGLPNLLCKNLTLTTVHWTKMRGPRLAANLKGVEHHTACHHTEWSQQSADVRCQTKYFPCILEAAGLNLSWMMTYPDLIITSTCYSFT